MDAAVKVFGGRACDSLAEIVARRPDVCFVLTNEAWHYEAGLPLLEAGLPRVLFEKPLVAADGQAHVSEADFHRGRELLRIAKARGSELAMMFNYRFFDQTLEARRIVAERGFGRLVNVSGQVHYACWSHCIDLVHLFGGAAETITALQGTVEHEGQGIVARDVVAAFRLAEGADGTLIGTSAMKWQHPLFELSLTFEGGRLHMRDIDGALEVLDGANRTIERYSRVRDASRWDHYGASFRKALSAYLNAVRAGTPAPVQGLDGLRELQFEAALKRSITEARPVSVQTEFPLHPTA